MTAEPFHDTTADPPVRGFLHRGSSADALVLTHGAGGNCNAPLLVALADLFCANGLTVLRCDLPYRQARPRGAPSPATAARDQAGLRRAVELMRGIVTGRVFLGGVSYGGRQASMLAAGTSGLTEALLLLSYPLHPPGRPNQLRTAHFAQLRTPALFVSGTKDAFGSIGELQSALALIPAQTQLLTVKDAGHSLLTTHNRGELPARIVETFTSFVAAQTQVGVPRAGGAPRK